jgi:hypothetical protein
VLLYETQVVVVSRYTRHTIHDSAAAVVFRGGRVHACVASTTRRAPARGFGAIGATVQNQSEYRPLARAHGFRSSPPPPPIASISVPISRRHIYIYIYVYVIIADDDISHSARFPVFVVVTPVARPSRSRSTHHFHSDWPRRVISFFVSKKKKKKHFSPTEHRGDRASSRRGQFCGKGSPNNIIVVVVVDGSSPPYGPGASDSV